MEKKAVAIEIVQTDNKFEIKTEMPMIPTEIVQTLVNEISERCISQATNTFLNTKDGGFVEHLVSQVEHYKFWNKFLYILVILVTVFFVFFAR
jgi:hypothetical protein